LTLRNCGVSTSGDREQFLDAGGKRYSHIVDPESGTGLTDGLSATVIAPSGMLADGLATAIRVMGEKRSEAFMESRPCVIVLLTNAAGSSWFLPANASPAADATVSRTHGCLPRNGSIP
jgi:thiamine biosynthesis lipoprotein